LAPSDVHLFGPLKRTMVANSSLMVKRLKGGVEMAETNAKKLACSGFRSTGKAMGQRYHCWRRVCREVNVFARFEYHAFHFSYSFAAYFLTLPRTCVYNLLSCECVLE
jgi:hypothetical protein